MTLYEAVERYLKAKQWKVPTSVERKCLENVKKAFLEERMFREASQFTEAAE